MKKYGLQLRVPPSQQKKTAARPPLPPPLGFRDDDDDDVEKEISRQATKNKSLKDIEEQHKKALEEDPSVFDYDGVYDEMKEKIARPRAQDREERKPKYIQALLEKAKEREREHEIMYDRKLAKERSKDDHLYADKDKFVTSAYKKKLAEQAKWMEEDRLHQLREEREDVTKKTDLSDFYFNLEKNVAFGAKDGKSRLQEKQTELRKPDKQDDKVSVGALEQGPSFSDSKSASELSSGKEAHQGESSLDKEVQHGGISSPKRISETLDVHPVANESGSSNTTVQQPAVEQPIRDHHKRNEDALAAAKERFLARKKAKGH